MDKVYVVVGSTGEFDARSSWNVEAFASRERAQRLCDFLNMALKHYCCHRTILDTEKYNPSLKEECLKILELLDSKARIDYTGSNYYIVDIPFKDE